MRKPTFCICENKDADQLPGNREADQRLCFRCKDSKIPLLPKSEISSLFPSSMAVQPGFCRTWSETPEDRFSHNTSQILQIRDKISHVVVKPVFGVSNQVRVPSRVQPQKMVRGLKLRI